MSDQPATFTFLFTDVEGSSRLWEENAEAMARALARHDKLLSGIFSGHGGHVFKMMGDSVCVAFSKPSNALPAAIEAQRALLAEEWETPRPLRVRAAIHHGFAEQRNADYFGPTLNRTARLLAAGHGEQVLLSRAAQERTVLPDGVSLRDLGERRLRDLTLPERIFQLVAPGLRSDFPPLRSMEVLPNNLPAQLTSFIGRERDLGEVKRLLDQSRLVTLTGPGGTGKTRLSLQAAAELLEHFIDGVWLVELATVSDPDAIWSTVAAALGLREDAERSLADMLVDYLKTKKLLLILDNCEHLVAACASLAERLLRGAPQLRILASSREALVIAGESTYPVQSLSLPDFFEGRWTSAEIAARWPEFESVRLFVERAKAVQPDFKLSDDNALTIAKICWRLDGIPLAIELAAARVKMLSPEQIHRRLDDRFHLLTSGGRTVMPRQQTLTALIDWSYELLSEKERALLRRASVFGRGRTLKTLEAVCSGDGIEQWEILDLAQQLIDKSLLSAEHTDFGSTRYFMLESVWVYARAKLLESGEGDRVRSRHLDYFLKLADEAEIKLAGPEQSEWIEKLTVEHSNMRLALEWSSETSEGVERGLRLAGALLRYWEVHNHLQEGRDHYAALLARPEAQARTAIRAKALLGAGRLAWCQDDDEAAHKQFQEAIELYRELGDESAIAFVRSMLGFVEWSRGNGAIARTHFKAAVDFGGKHDAKLTLAIGLSGLGTLASAEGDYGTARVFKTESMAAYREIGDQWIVSLIGWSLAKVVIAQGDFQSARALLAESAAIAEQLGNEWLVPYVLECFGDIAIEEKDAGFAARLYAAAEVLRERLGLPPPPTEREAYDRAVARMRAQLADDSFTQAWSAGRLLSPSEAIRLAVSGKDQPSIPA